MPTYTPQFDESEAQPFNLQATLGRLGGDHKLLATLVDIFVEDSPALLEQIRAGCQAGDSDRVQYSAHSLRGLAGNFDATTLTANALDLERLATADRLADESVPSIVESIAIGVEQLRQTLPAAAANISVSRAS